MTWWRGLSALSGENRSASRDHRQPSDRQRHRRHRRDREGAARRPHAADGRRAHGVPATIRTGRMIQSMTSHHHDGGEEPACCLWSMRKCRRRRSANSSRWRRPVPGKFNYASPGARAQSHLVIELFESARGHPDAARALSRRRAAMPGDGRRRDEFTAYFDLASLPQIQAGTLRPIATGNPARDAAVSRSPDVAEQGFPDFEAIQWVGLLTTAGTPRRSSIASTPR